MKFLLTILILTSSAMAASFIRGEGKFQSKKNDGHEFVKKQLMYEGFVDIISKEMVNLGLNKNLFWERYNQELNKGYASIESKLKSSMEINEQSSQTLRQKYYDSLRLKKLKYKERFGNIQMAISRFAIKKISRSSKSPTSRYIKVEGTVNGKALNKLYYKFVAGNTNSDYGKLLINLENELVGITFSELDIKNEKDFNQVISKKWIEWFEKNKPQNISSVDLLSRGDKEALLKFQNLRIEEMLENTPKKFKNALLLDIQVRVIRQKYDKRKNEYTFKYVGAAYLKEIQSNLVIKTYEFEDSLKSYKIDPDVYLANIVVNHVYNMALGSFPKITDGIKRVASVSNVERIRVLNYPNMNSITSLVDLLENRGIKYGLQASIESLSSKNAELIVHLNGEKTDLRSLVLGLRSAKRTLKYDLVEQDGDLGIKFN